MAFIDEILSGTKGPGGAQNLQIVRVADAIAEPVTADEVMSFSKAVSAQDLDNVNLLIPAIRQTIEDTIEQAIFTQTWKQTLDDTPRVVQLYRRPAQSIVSIKTIQNYNDDTQTTMNSTFYSLAGSKLWARQYWPPHRGFQSFEVIFKAGMVPLVEGVDPAATEVAVTAARLLVPGRLKLAILNYVGHFFENREGEGPENAYEHLISLQQNIGEMPKNVKLLIQPFLDYRP